MFRIRLSEWIFEIDNRFPDIEKLCTDYITDKIPDHCIQVSEAEMLAENTGEFSYALGYLETLAIYRKICELLWTENTYLFHCSAMEIDGKAFLLAAPSGTGKSTHARLWRQVYGDRVVMINDDKPLLRCTEDEIIVYGTPWAGKENLQTNTCASVAGIIILHQAKENTIRRMTSREAFPTLLNQTYRVNDAAGMKATMDFVWRLSSLPVFSLGCTISEEAVLLAHKSLMECTAYGQKNSKN